jgi:hypothetical protein
MSLTRTVGLVSDLGRRSPVQKGIMPIRYLNYESRGNDIDSFKLNAQVFAFLDVEAREPDYDGWGHGKE